MKINFSLQQYLVLLTFVAMLPIVGIALYAGFTEIEDELQRARSNLQFSASLIAAEQERFLESTKQLLLGVAIAPGALSGNAEKCRGYFRNLQQRLPMYNNFGIIDRDGYSRCHAGVSSDTIYLGDRPYFRDAIAKRDLVVGEYTHGRLLDQHTVALGVPLFDGNALTGVAFAELDLDIHEKTLLGVARPKSMRISIVDGQATVFSSTESSYPVGSQIDNTLLRALLKRLKVGQNAGLSGESDTGRLFAIRPILGLGNGELFAVIGVDKNDILGGIRRRLVWESLCLFIMVLLGSGLAFWLGRQWIAAPAKKMLTAFEGIAAGNLDFRLPSDGGRHPKEFARITQGFNLMAVALKTWQQRLALELSKSRQTLLTQEMILNSMHEGLLAVNAEGEILLRNTAANRLLDLGLSDASIAKSAQNYGLFTPDGRDRYPLKDLPSNRALQGESGEGLLVLIRSESFPEGRLFSCSYAPISGLLGVFSALVVFSDVTEKYRLEIQRDHDHLILLNTQRMLLEAQNVGRIGSWEHDLDSNTHWWSTQVYDLFGATTLDFDGSYADFLKFILPADRAHFCVQRDIALHTETGLNVEYRIVRSNGEIVWLHEVGEVRKNAAGKPIKFLGVVQDISERAKAEQDLRAHLATMKRAAMAALAISSQQSVPDIVRETATQAIATLDAQDAHIELGGSDFIYMHEQQLREVEVAAPNIRPIALGETSDGKVQLSMNRNNTHPVRLTQAERCLRASSSMGDTQAQGAPPIGGMLTVPLIGTDGALVGLLRLIGKADVDFTQHDEYVAVELAQLASIALENAKRFAQIESFNAELERKVSERTAELMQQQALFRTVADQAPQVMWIANLKRQVTYLNRYWYELVGGSEPVWFGEAWTRVVDPSDASAMQQKWEAVVQAGHSFEGVRRIHALNGEVRVLSYRVSPVKNETGEIFCWVGIDADITELTTTQSALQLAVQDLEAFSYSASHDLRSPLSTVGGFSDLLSKKLVGSADTRALHYASKIQAGVKQMGELIEGLISLAQVSRTKLRLESVDLSQLSTEILHRHRVEDATRNVSVTVEAGLQAHGDARLLRAVLTNLLGNAWKFTSRKTHAEITISQQKSAQGEVIFTIQDNGAGFDMAYADKLFTTFQRLHSSDEFTGTGIGLATVHRIIASHGGRIWAESQIEQGASFFFTLPRAQA